MQIVLIVLVVIFVFTVCSTINVKVIDNLTREINNLGYKDMPDIRVFCYSIGRGLEDFISSKGIRNQYELFAKGTSSGFIQQAQAEHKADIAQSNGFVGGLVAGMALGNSGE